MTEYQGQPGTEPDPTSPSEEPTERLAAHERLSTGALSSWARACATTVAGRLQLARHHRRSDRPRRDRRRLAAGRVRDPGLGHTEGGRPDRGRIHVRAGRVLNIVFAAPAGQRLDTPTRRAAIEKAIARLRSPEFKPTDGKAGLTSVDDPFSKATFSKTAASPTPRRNSTRRSRTRTGTRSSPSRIRCDRPSSRRA